MTPPQSEFRLDALSVPTATRLDGLDWLRAGAAVLVVALHAGIAYLIVPMPGLAWATRDPHGDALVDGATWWINGFIMPLFFVQSGYLAAQLLRQKGSGAFLRHRTRRLLAPFAFACVAILPLDLYAWLLGWAADGKITLHKLRSLKIDSPLADNLWGVSHLWFLQYLWVFCVGAWLIARLVRRHGSPEALRRISFAPPSVALLMGVSAFALWWEPQVLIGFRHSWWPLPANLLFYGPWFALGWGAQVRAAAEVGNLTSTNSLARLPRHPFEPLCEWRVVAAVGIFALLLPRIHQHVMTSSVGMDRSILAGLFVLHAWLMVGGLFGLSLRWLNRRPPAAVKYLAEASFWLYLFHHPVVGLTQVSVSQTGWPVAVKAGVTLAAGISLPLLTYDLLIRRTWVGLLLNGRRTKPNRNQDAPAVLQLPTPEPASLRKSA